MLVGCEISGVVRDAFRRRGHEAYSCDLQASESPYHIQADILEVLYWGWDLLIAHPPCQYLSVSGMHWTTRGLRDPQLTEDALLLVRRLMDAPIPKKVIENPVSIISSRIRKPDQVIQPYDFGDDASKRTCLWLEGVSPLVPTHRVSGRWVLHNGKRVERWGNQTDSGQNRLGPSPDRAQQRAETYPGVAAAMAAQWG